MTFPKFKTCTCTKWQHTINAVQLETLSGENFCQLYHLLLLAKTLSEFYIHIDDVVTFTMHTGKNKVCEMYNTQRQLGLAKFSPMNYFCYT